MNFSYQKSTNELCKHITSRFS
uniref:Uncharacterized protein n=1 Tax=Arundo donax TaxID=35708 RepID=A0A0A9FLA1_ARUDO